MTFLEETIIGGFIGEAISKCIDTSWSHIKEVIKDRKNKKQNIESQIYNVIINVFNQITYNRYRDNQDKIYQAAERLLIGYKYEKCDNFEAVKSSLQFLDESVNAEKYMEFTSLLYNELSKDDYVELYRQIRLLQQDEERNKTARIEGKVDRVQQGVDETNRRLSAFQENNRGKDNIQNKKLLKCRTQEYADKWNQNLFLNDFDKRDENAGKNIKLREIYLEEHLPHYIWGTNLEPFTDLKKLLREYIIENTEKSMLLILGQSGVGKSTLITWILANFKQYIDDFFVYQFASDLKEINWNSDDILDQILTALNMEYDELENRTLILDGFDEISIGDKSEEILNRLYQEIRSINLIKCFTVIITCRENYVWKFHKIECNYITLQPWDSEQITSFCKKYAKENASTISSSTIKSILENKEVLGIPLILYMTLALNVSLWKSGSIVDIYDHIFSLEGGSIYDRCIRSSRVKSLRFADPHRISQFKLLIHEVSKKIAFWIFENEPEEIFIPQIEYEKICDDVITYTQEKSEEIKRDFLIGNYFKLTKHVEKLQKNRLYFVHRSIYEYFIADYIFESICDITSHEEIAGKFGKILKKGALSKQILDFMKYKFENYEKGNILNDVMKVFKIMLQDGMTYYTKEVYKNVVDKEISIFSNMLKVVFLWNRILGELDKEIINYLRYNNRIELKLEGIRLENANLNRVYLENAYLSGAELNGIDLQEACLNGAKLIGAYLRKALLNGAKMNNADLSKADLIGAKLNRVHLNGAELIGTRLINAELKGAELNNAKLNLAELNKADLRDAKIDGIELNGAYLKDAIFDEKQVALLEKKYDLSSSKIFLYQTDTIIDYKDYAR